MLNWNTGVNYQDLRFQIILNTEGSKSFVYSDGRGIATNGIGFNLRLPSVLRAVLDAMHVGVAFVPPALQAAEAGYVAAITQAAAQTYPSSPNGGPVRVALDAIMAARAQNSGGTIALSTFTLTSAQIQQVFNTIAPSYESTVDGRIGSVIPDSAERAVLFSFAYNGGAGLLGSRLVQAINGGNRAEAWYEIRYGSNARSEGGVAKRRYYESQIFGLFDASGANPEAGYKSAFAMYTRHEASIKSYDQALGSWVTRANRDYAGAQVQSTTKPDGKGGLVEDLGGVFAPAATYLIAHYATGQSIDQIFAASNDPLYRNVVVDRTQDGASDLILGSDGNDTLTAGSGHDYLYGGIGNDIVRGNANPSPKAVEVLVGGAGGPGARSAGNDTIIAGSGQSVLIGDTGTANFVVDAQTFAASANIIWADANSPSTYNLTGKSLVYLVNISNATLQSVEQYGSDSASFADFFKSATGYAPGALGEAATIIINPNPSDTLVLNGATLSAGQFMHSPPNPGDTTTIVVGDNQVYTPLQSSSIVAAVGNNIQINDPFSDSLLSFGSNNKLNYTGDGSVAGVSNSSTGQSTNDTIIAGGSSNVLIGNGNATTFKVDTNRNFGSVTVIWNKGGAENIDITGGADIYEITAPASLQSIQNLDVNALLAAVQSKEQDSGGGGGEGIAAAQAFSGASGASIILINPTNAQISVDGRKVSGGSYGLTSSSTSVTDIPQDVDVIDGRPVEFDFHGEVTNKQYGVISGDGFNYNINGGPVVFSNADGVYRFGFISSAGDTTSIYGVKNGDLGITFTGNGPDSTAVGSITYTALPRSVTYPYGTISGTQTFNDVGGNLFDGGFYTAATPEFDLSLYQNAPVVAAAIAGAAATSSALAATSQAYTNVTDVYNVFDTYVIDTLVSLDAARAFEDYDILVGNTDANSLTAFGAYDTLIAGGAQSQLMAEGTADVLVGNALGSTLDGSYGQNAIAAYIADHAVIDLGAGTATVAGLTTSDTLIAVTGASALGSNDTLIGGAGVSSLFSNVGTNTLIAGAGTTVAVYAVDGATVDLTAGTAYRTGLGAADTLIGIQSATVSGSGSVVIAAATGGTLTAAGANDTLLESGSDALLIATGSSDLLVSSGSDNSLVATSPSNTLVSTGANDVFIANGGGSTLDGSGGVAVLADYGNTDYLTIDLSAGTAQDGNSSVGDRLIGIHAVHVGGTRDTLIAGAPGDTLIATGSYAQLYAGNVEATLIASGQSDTLYGSGTGSTLDGSGGTGAIAAYSVDNAVASLVTNQVSVGGAPSSDVLIGIGGLAAFGSNDTLIANSGNTLIGFADHDVLVSAGSDNSLIDNYGTGTLISTGTDDTLFGSGFGTVLDASGATSAFAVYSGDDVTVDLSVGTATTRDVQDEADQLIGIRKVRVDGDGDVAVGGTSDDVLVAGGANSTLFGGAGSDILVSVGNANTLIASGGADTLLSFGNGDVLFGDAAGTSIDASGGTNALLAYSADNVTVDLSSGTASFNGANVSDRLIGVRTLTAYGAHDTLIGGASATTLIGQTANDTLIAGTGPTLLLYKRDGVTVDLGAGVATANGTVAADTLVGMSDVEVDGTADTVIASSGNNTLTAAGTSEVLNAGSGNDTLVSTGIRNTLFGGSGASVLSTSGTLDTLLAGSGLNTLSTNGSQNILVAGTGIATLIASGANDTLVGNGGGSTLIGGFVTQALAFSPNDSANSTGFLIGDVPDTGTVAAYAVDHVTVDLSSGTATVAGSNASDTLLGIADAAAYGSNDTLIGSNTHRSTLTSNVHGNTLIAGTAGTAARYALADVVVDLSAGSASMAGSALSDALVGITAAEAAGQNDTLIAGGATTSLTSSGQNNNLVAGAVATSLVSTGTDDTLFGNGAGSTLVGDESTVAAYAMDHATVNLSTASASLNGSSSSDSLIGIQIASALGTNDTLIAQYAGTTLISNGAGNTLIGNNGAATAGYSSDDITIDLVAQTASIAGSSTFDTLVGMRAALVSGTNDTIISDGSGNTLSVANSTDVVAYAVDNVAVNLASGTASVSGAFSSDTLVGASNAVITGSNSSVTGGVANGTLEAEGTNDTLIAGSYAESLIAAGSDDTLVGNLLGSVLDGTRGNGVIALFTADQTTIDLGRETAADALGTASDTLLGIHAIAGAGHYDTLIGSAGDDTLLSSGSFNSLTGGGGEDLLISTGSNDTLFAGNGDQTLISQGVNNSLIAGAGANVLLGHGTNDQLWGNASGATLDGSGGLSAVAVYNMDNLIVDLSAGTAEISGSTTSDTLSAIASVTVYGQNDAVQSGDADGVLTSHGSANTLTAGGGLDTLVSDGSYDTLRAANGGDTLISSGWHNSLVANSGANILSSSGAGDVLLAGSGADSLRSSGIQNTLVAGSGADFLSSSGANNTLVGNGAGSTLDGTQGINVLAAYADDNVVINLAAGTATLDGGSLSDKLVGITQALALGTNDTLIGGSLATTLFSNGAGNTMIAGSGATTVAYALDGVTIDLSALSATVNGAAVNDTLVGITRVAAFGANDTLIGAGAGDVLMSGGQDNTLIAGGAANSLVSTGSGDLLFGNAVGSTLDGRGGLGVVAAYALDNVKIDLSSGTAGLIGSAVSDTLIGIDAVMAVGAGDTLIGGSGATTLYSNAAGNTLIAGTGQTVAAFELDDVTVDLSSGTAQVNGSSVGDTLIGVASVIVSGSGDILIGGSGNDTLASDGGGNTLIAGSGLDVLISVGEGDTLYGNAAGSRLDATNGSEVVAAYATDNLIIDLSAGTARVNGASAFDTLVGVTEAAVLGTSDTLIAGLGDETLFGGGGANTFVYASEDGNDVISDSGHSSQAVFSDIASAGVTFSISPDNSDDLLITINGTGNTVTIDGQFGASGTGELQHFLFADGVTFTAAQVATLAGASNTTTPTVDVSIDHSLLNLASPTATVTFAFSAAPSAFTLADTSVIGGTLSNLAGSGSTYTATFTAAAGTDISNASVSVNANSWQASGASGAGGSSSSFTVDTVTPTVAISVDHNAMNVAGPTALVTFTFSDAPTSFTLADVNAAGGVLSNLSGSGSTYTATFTAASNTQTANASVAVNAGSWQNADGNAGAGGTSSTFTVDTVTPAVSSIVTSPASGDENTGNVVHLTLTMNKSVSVTGTPALTLNDGATAVYQSGSGTNTLVFAYTVANGQNSSALAVIGNNLDGYSIAITDADGNAADLTGADVTFPGLMVGATVASVTASRSSGDLGPAKVVTFTVTTTEPVTITGGTPTLSLNDGGIATYKSGSGSNSLKFAYTVGAVGSGQNTPALAVTGFNPNGATVYDSGVAADTADLSGVASFTNGPQVDTTAPTISSVIATPSSGDFDAGNSITITVGFSESVTVTGSPYLALNDGGKATYAGGSGSNSLSFTYTVAAGQNTNALAVSSMSANGGTIRDGAGISAVLTGAANSLGGTIQVDTKAPAVTERLTSDTGVSKTDLITSNGSLSGGGDASAVVHFTVDGTTIAATAAASSTGVWTYVPTGLADGSHTMVASETDAAGNIGTATLTFTQDTTAPSATDIAANPANGDFDAGNTVALTVQFSDAVYATSTSYLLLNDGGKALYSSGTGTSALTFTYTVAAGQNTANLAVTGFSSGVTDVAGNLAVLAGTATNPGGTIQIDTTAPNVTSIAASGAGIVVGKGDLGPGQTVTLTVNFGEAVLVNTAGGTPTLALSNGGVATYVSGSRSSALTFAYTVGALGGGQDSADLKLASTSAVNLNGATITDLAGNAAVLTAAKNYNPAGVLQIDTTAPTITKVVSSPATGDVTTGHVVKITLTPSEAVTVGGTPELLLNDGGIASYDAAHSTSKALVFNYTAAAGDTTPNLAVSGIELPTGSSINDLAGNGAVLAGAASSLGVQINTTTTGSSGPETGNITLSGGTNAELFGASLANVSFDNGSTGTLRLDASSQFSGTVAGLALGNYVDLADLAYQGNSAPVYSSSGTNAGSVAVTEGTTTINVALLGSYLANSFVASSDGHGGTLITDPPPPPQVMLGPSLHA